MMTKEQLDALRGHTPEPVFDHIDEQQAEIDRLRQHAEMMAKALDNIEVMTDDDQGEIRWTAVYALNAYRKAYPRRRNDE